MIYKVYLKYLMLNIFSLMMLMLIVLMGVAFLTLMERKLLSYIQMRKGPNKVGVIGIFQPFSDAIKLFTKELFYIYKSNYMIFYICPMVSFLLMLSMWLLIPYITNIYFLNYSILLMLIYMTISSYVIIFMGWSSNSIYSMIGSMRSVSQMLSYEVSFMFIILILMLMSESYSIIDFINYQLYLWYLVILYPLFLMFFISMLAELNRSPMDFIEGESELVSGFNIEYFSGGFILIFLSEYGMIIFFSLISVYMFTSLFVGSLLLMFMMINLMCLVVVFMRGMLPRMRYDELMYLCWKVILPLVLMYVLGIVGFKMMILSSV